MGAYRLDPDLETDSRWALTLRIINSPHFVKSSQLQDFLLYVCRCAMENRIDEISERRIGERVFERESGKIRQGEERLPYFELLIRTITLAGVAQESEVISYRILKR